MKNYAALTLIFFVLMASPCLSQIPGQELFDNSKIHEIKITSLFEALSDSMTNDYLLSFGFGQIQTRKVPYRPALITIDGTLLDSIGIRQKGFNSWWSSDKKPLKIDINKYTDQAYDGLSKFNLHNGSGDPSFIRENLSYNLLRSLGIKAPRTAYAKVFMDDDYLGVYRVVEQIDNTYLDVNYGQHEGNLYVQQSKGSGGFDFSWISNNQEDYYESLELENHQKTNDWSALIHFMDVLNHSSDANFKTEIQAVFDVEEYLQILAFDLAINNLDWYGSAGRNYYIVEVDGKFHWLPWDYNLSWREGAPSINVSAEDYPVLIQRILKVPAFYDSFIRKYCVLLPLLSNDSFDALVDNEIALIKPLMADDPVMDYPDEAFETNSETSWGRIPGLKEFAANRLDEIMSTLESLQLDCDQVTGVPVVLENKFEIYPIPVNHVLHITSFTYKEIEVTIFNSIGQELLRTKVIQSGVIDVTSLKPGYYILKANMGSELHTRLIKVAR